MAYPETASFRDFARIAGFKPGYITQLKAADRLVLTEDGKSVRVADSLQRIKDTSDPTRIGVVRRHADARAAADLGDAVPPAPDDRSDDTTEDTEKSPTYQHWRERGERAKALALERDNDIAERKLLLASEIEPAVASAFTLIRARVESLPDILGDELAIMTEPAQVRARLREEIEHLLNEASAKLDELGKAAA
jgi:hypothetical protein